MRFAVPTPAAQRGIDIHMWLALATTAPTVAAMIVLAKSKQQAGIQG